MPSYWFSVVKSPGRSLNDGICAFALRAQYHVANAGNRNAHVGMVLRSAYDLSTMRGCVAKYNDFLAFYGIRHTLLLIESARKDGGASSKRCNQNFLESGRLHNGTILLNELFSK
jgi:hypothetical protein